jgi:hypothetical protein
MNHNGWRNITPSDVEEVLRGAMTARRRLSAGRRKYQGRTESGRLLTVIVEVLGPNRLRPRTAWEVPR